MKFNKIENIILLGGSRILYELAMYLRDFTSFKHSIFTSHRQLLDVIMKNNITLKDVFDREKIEYYYPTDINKSKDFIDNITTNTLAIGLGEIWNFNQEVIDLLNCRLLDLMGIRLPQYRGGAHYTWQILRGNKIGACNLQIVNKDMIQGVYDSGEIIKFKEYLFPPEVRIPNDYFNFAVEQEILFLKEFLDEVELNKEFTPFRLQENFSIYFPRLNTEKNAFIDWQWKSADIEKFICAFDDPYQGVSTQLNGKLVRLKKAIFESNDGPFHPFQSGLIYKKYDSKLYVATLQGTIIISEVFDEFGNSIIDNVEKGGRFFTPTKLIEEGFTFKSNY